MDDRVRAVLDEYHAQIRQERGGFGPGGHANGLDERLLAVGPDTGQLINVLARSLKAPVILEIGTSYGYSGIWLGEAARAAGGRLITSELHDYKAAHAKKMAAEAGLADYIDFRVGDALQLIADLEVRVDFVLLDLWKDLYVPCLEAFFPKLNPGAIIVADNMSRGGGEGTRRYQKVIRAMPRVSSLFLPVGSGLEVSRIWDTMGG